jgi:hypothetical protein
MILTFALDIASTLSRPSPTVSTDLRSLLSSEALEQNAGVLVDLEVVQGLAVGRGGLIIYLSPHTYNLAAMQAFRRNTLSALRNVGATQRRINRA